MASQTEPSGAGVTTEMFMRPSDGRLVPLILQSIEDPRVLPETSQWTRMGKPPSRLPSLMHVSCWITSPLDGDNHTPAAVAWVVLRFLVTWPLLFVLGAGFDDIWKFNANMEVDYSGLVTTADQRYDTVRFGEDNSERGSSSLRPSARAEPQGPGSDVEPATQHTSYLDNIGLDSGLEAVSRPRSGPARQTSPAPIRPRYLCLARDFDTGQHETVKVSDYLEREGDDADLEFVFVSYTRLQFRVATEQEIDAYDYPDEATREANRQLAASDRQMLIRWGMDAAKRAGKRAFWLDFECVRDEDGVARSSSSSEDVYRICDIVRAAHSMIIAIGPSTSDKIASILAGEDTPEYDRENVTPWLRQWGSRLWTLPELLLCPREYRIQLYVVGDASEPKAMAKRNFAERAWDDAEAVRNLVNHFEGSAILTPQHLIEAALTCFSRRQTDQFSQGDVAYAIMGLFPNRQRPAIVPSDSGLHAFARLCLANDSGSFLERLICLDPLPGAPWFQMTDRWGARLRDVHATIQVREVLDEETVLLDGVHGATIHWDSIDAEPIFVRPNMLSTLFVMLHIWNVLIPKVFLFIVVMIEVGMRRTSTSADRAVLGYFTGTVTIMSLFAMLVPWILFLSRKAVGLPMRPRLIGIEGTVDIATVEKYLWGYKRGVFTDITPQDYSDANATPAGLRDEGIQFTLVDTQTLTLTHFRATRPPTAMLICGNDGSMQRALLCSYDWATKTFRRQKTMRVAHRDLDLLHRVDRLRYVLTKHKDEARSPLTNGPISPVAIKTPDNEIEHEWMAEHIFFCLCIVACKIPWITFPSERNDEYFIDNDAYSVGFIVAQLLAVLILSRVPMNRIFQCITMLKGFNHSLPYVAYTYKHVNVAVLLCVQGCIDGIFFLTLMTWTWSWYRKEQLPVRFLAWGFATSLIVDGLIATLDSHNGGRGLFRIAFTIIVTLIFFSLAFMGSGKVGGPMEVTWLSTPQKLYTVESAAVCQQGLKTLVEAWPSRKARYMVYTKPLLYCVLSLSITATTSYTVAMRDSTVAVGLLLVVVAVAVIVARLPNISFPIMGACSLISGVLLVLPSAWKQSQVILIAIRLHDIVLPLLWAHIASDASEWFEATTVGAASLAGTSAGMMLSRTTAFEGLAARIPMLVVQAALWALLWFQGRGGKMKTVAVARRDSENGEGINIAVDP
ncbi:hypothetical protein S40288_01537 [Stachybotrys chartarum IBT 40288]|nr:hypothetical protein S40288_01537 [Stachybotrys chartarum IBT 40288]